MTSDSNGQPESQVPPSAEFEAALETGDPERLEKLLTADPALVRKPIGTRLWAPLLHVYYSRTTRHAAETARLLLRYGADPNSSFLDNGHPLSCLYGASGLRNNPELTRVLLDAGADPNDGESVYHSTEHVDLACLRLVLERGGRASEGLHHMLDREDLRGLLLLLTFGADPNRINGTGGTGLHWAVWRERGT